MKKKSLISILTLSLLFSLTACTNTDEQPESATPTDAQPTTTESITYEDSDNSLDALVSRAYSSSDSKYLVSHWGESQCHIVIGAKQTVDGKQINTIIDESDINLERLIDCNIDSDNVCVDCGYHYSAEEMELPNRLALITAELEANQPETTPEPTYGLKVGVAPFYIDSSVMYKIDLTSATIENSTISTDKFDLDISVINDKVNGKIDGYLPNESNLDELVETVANDITYKSVKQYTDENKTELAAVYIIKDLDKGCIINKFSDITMENNDNLVEELTKYISVMDIEYDESTISKEDFYKDIASKNSTDFKLNSATGEISLDATYVLDCNKVFVDNKDNISEVYISIAEDNTNKIVALTTYKYVDITIDNGFELLTQVNDEEELPKYYVYQKDKLYFVVNTSETENNPSLTYIGIGGVDNEESVLEFYSTINK